MDNNPVWNQLKGNWKQFVGNVKERWGDLTDDEILEAAGEREQLAGKIQARYGKTQEAVNTEIDEWANNLKF